MKNKIRILHIDDSFHDRQLVKDAFREQTDEYHIIEADNRALFEKNLAEGEFDIILSDFNILDFDGFQVLSLVKEKHPDLPVIIVTGTGSEEIAVQAMKMGADDYVIKTDMHIKNLVPTIKHVLERKQVEVAHKQAITALEESEERFRLLFEYSMDAVLLTVPYGGIHKANPAACRIFGKTEEEIVRGGREGIIDLNDPRLEQALRTRAESGQFIGELTGFRNDGTPFPIEVSSALFKDKSGNIKSSLIARDISERKAAEDAIRKRIEQLEHFHQLTVGRELVMIELKKEVNELLRKLGEKEKYR